MSNSDNVVLVGTKTGKILVYNYFDGSMIDYEIVHSSSVKKICLEIERRQRDVVYAFDLDDPRNKAKALKKIYSMSNESVIVSKYSREEAEGVN